MTGHTTYRLEGCQVHVTPWVRPYMDADTVRFIVAEMMLVHVGEATISADGPRGPFMARVIDFRGRGATPLDAFRSAIDERERMARARARALP